MMRGKITLSKRKSRIAWMIVLTLVMQIFIPVLMDTSKVYADSEQIDLGAFDFTAAKYENATGNSDTLFNSLVVGYSQKQGSESITLPTVDGYNYQQSISTDGYSYVITFSDKTAKQIAEDYIRQIQFNGVVAGTEMYIILSKTAIKNKTIYYAANQHFYQYVKFNGTVLDWVAAYNAAKGSNFAGRQGYLATITSAEENNFIYSASQSVGWLGGTILKHGNQSGNYYDGFTTSWTNQHSKDGGTTPDNVDELETKWYWACGPEIGKTFYDRRFSTDSGDSKQDYSYNAWNNNEPNQGGGDHEQCLATVSGASNFTWNNIIWNRNDGNSSWMPQGYFIEYGDETEGNSSTTTGDDVVIFKKIGKATVTFDSNGGTAVASQSIEPNSKATEPNNPTRTNYVFEGWYSDSELTEVFNFNTVITGDITLYAKWKPEQYTIKFTNEDGTELSSKKYDYGTRADAIEKPDNPTKAATAEYTYTFAKWVLSTNDTETIGDVTADATYKATYTSTKNKYTVIFVDEDGTTVLKAATEYDYGTPAASIVKPDNPTKAATAENTYTFVGWEPSIEDVTGDVSYKATYTSTINKYEVKWENYDNTLLQEDTVDYGVTPEYTGTEPTRSADEKYTYTFIGWTPEISEVTGDITYTATYKATEIPEGEKAVSTGVKSDGKSPELKPDNLTNEFAESTLTDSEKEIVEAATAAGNTVDIDVYLAIKDIADSVAAADKEKIQALAADAGKIAYFDIALFKEISINNTPGSATPIHTLAKPLKLTIEIPKSFPAVADGYARSYTVLRLHDGKAEKLPTTLNADGTISFETNKFSVYALAYTDMEKEADDDDSDWLEPLRTKLHDAGDAGGAQTVEHTGNFSLPIEFMTYLKEHPQVTLIFHTTYDGEEITVTIPGSKAIVDEKISWYGPLWLKAHYGAGAATKTVKSPKTGDTLYGYSFWLFIMAAGIAAGAGRFFDRRKSGLKNQK